MKKKNRLLSKVMALSLAATMAFGLSMTAFAADPPTGTLPGNYSTGASSSNPDEHAYPEGLGGINGSADVTQYLDVTPNPATDITGKSTDRGTISVAGLEDGLTVTAYQVVKPVYSADYDDKFVGWDNAADGINVVVDAAEPGKGKTVDLTAFNRDNINKMASELADGTISAPSVSMTGTGGTYTNDDVEPGAYIVVVSGGEAKTYGAMVVSVYYTASAFTEDGAAAQGATLTLTSNMAFAKMQDAPDIKKAITFVEWESDVLDGELRGELYNDAKGKGTSATANIGDTVWFDIRINNIPEYHGTYPVFTVYDYMDTNLEYVSGSAQYGVMFGSDTTDYLDDDNNMRAEYDVTSQLASLVAVNPHSYTEGKIDQFEIEAGGARNELTFNFVDGTTFYLNKWAGYDLVIHYAAKIVSTEGNELDFGEGGVAAMPNNAVLEYTHNSDLDSSDYTDPTGDKTVYTAEIVLHKIDAQTKQSLAGAEFQLTYWDVNDETDVVVIDKLVSDEDGNIKISGIIPGKYYIHETKQPADYALSDVEYLITVSMKDAEGNDFNGSSPATSVSYTVDKNGNYTGTTVFDIPNVKMTDLPSTGGTGTAILVGLGICGAIAACFVIFGTRKKTEDAE